MKVFTQMYKKAEWKIKTLKLATVLEWYCKICNQTEENRQRFVLSFF